MKEPDPTEVEEVFDSFVSDLRGVRKNTTRRKKRKVSDHKRSGGRKSPIVEYVHSLGYLTTGEVAESLKVSKSYVRKLSKQRVTQAPSYVVPYGDAYLSLYTEDDVHALRKHIESLRTVLRTEDVDVLAQRTKRNQKREDGRDAD